MEKGHVKEWVGTLQVDQKRKGIVGKRKVMCKEWKYEWTQQLYAVCAGKFNASIYLFSIY